MALSRPRSAHRARRPSAVPATSITNLGHQLPPRSPAVRRSRRGPSVLEQQEGKKLGAQASRLPFAEVVEVRQSSSSKKARSWERRRPACCSPKSSRFTCLRASVRLPAESAGVPPAGGRSHRGSPVLERQEGRKLGEHSGMAAMPNHMHSFQPSRRLEMRPSFGAFVWQQAGRLRSQLSVLSSTGEMAELSAFVCPTTQISPEPLALVLAGGP